MLTVQRSSNKHEHTKKRGRKHRERSERRKEPKRKPDEKIDIILDEDLTSEERLAREKRERHERKRNRRKLREEKENNEPSEPSEPSDHEELPETPNHSETPEDTEIFGFLFVYEANGTYFTKLSDIDKTDGRMVVIHPVLYTGYTNNMESEEVVYDHDKDKYITGSDNGSWLDILYGYPDSVYNMEIPQIISYENKHYHCDSCLLHHLFGDKIEEINLI